MEGEPWVLALLATLEYGEYPPAQKPKGLYLILRFLIYKDLVFEATTK